MLVIVFWLMLVIVPVVAKAETVTLSWTNPTETESCSNAGPLTNLAGTRIYQLVADIPDPALESYTIPGLLPDTYEYVATSYDEEGVNSRLSGTASKTVETFVVGTDTRVYSTIRSGGKFLLVAMGTVPAGTECDPTYSVAGDLPNQEGLATAYVVPADNVTWSGTSQTQTPVAKCE